MDHQSSSHLHNIWSNISTNEMIALVDMLSSQHDALIALSARLNPALLRADLLARVSSKKRKIYHADPSTPAEYVSKERSFAYEDIVQCIDEVVESPSLSEQSSTSFTQATKICLAVEALFIAVHANKTSEASSSSALDAMLKRAVSSLKSILSSKHKSDSSSQELKHSTDLGWAVALCLCRVLLAYPGMCATVCAECVLLCLKRIAPSVAPPSANSPPLSAISVSRPPPTHPSPSTIDSWIDTNDRSSIFCFLCAAPSAELSHRPLIDVWPSLHDSLKSKSLYFAAVHLQITRRESCQSMCVRDILHLASTIQLEDTETCSVMLSSITTAISCWLQSVAKTLQDPKLADSSQNCPLIREISTDNLKLRGFECMSSVISTFISVCFHEWSDSNRISHIRHTSIPNINEIASSCGTICTHIVACIDARKLRNPAIVRYLFHLRCLFCTLRILNKINTQISEIISTFDVACITLSEDVVNIPCMALHQLSNLCAAILLDWILHRAATDDYIGIGNSAVSLFLTKVVNMRDNLTSQSQASQDTSSNTGYATLCTETLGKVFRFTALTHPLIAVSLLGEMTYLWSLVDNNNPILYTTYEAIQSTIHTCPIITSTALMINPAFTTDKIILPLLRNSKFEDIKYTRLMLEFLFGDLKNLAVNYGQILVSKIILSKETSLIPILNVLRDVGPSPSRDFFDIQSAFEDNPLLYLNAIVSPVLIDVTEAQLIQGKLKAFLDDIAQPFDCQVPNAITGSLIQQLLTVIVKAFGLTDEMENKSENDTDLKKTALRALHVYAVLYQKKTMGVNKIFSKSDTIKDDTADLLSLNFLYIMSSIIQKDWVDTPTSAIQNRITSLQTVVSLLRQNDASKFIPKILFFVDTALHSDQVCVHLCIVELLQHFISQLSTKSLTENLQALVISFYSLIECNSSDVSVKSRGNLDSLTDIFESKLSLLHYCAYDNTSSRKCHKVLSILFEYAALTDITSIVRVKTIYNATEAIRKLFIERIHEFKDHLSYIPYIPAVEGLKSIREVHENEMSSLSFEQILRRMCDMLRHESAHVRLAALKKIRSVCNNKSKDLYKTLTMKESTIGSMSLQDVASSLLESLLQMCSTEASIAVRDECALCLGSIGAIDPARVNVILGSSNSNDPLPWQINDITFGYSLLCNHLIPSLKAASGVSVASSAQDRFSIAIQELLQFLAISANPHFIQKQSLPESVKLKLIELEIFDICEPFLTSRYNLPYDIEDMKYAHADTFERWIALWCRYLIQNLQGPYKPVLVTCRAAFKSRAALSKFLLPYLIVHVLLNKSDGQNEACTEIITEILRILRMPFTTNSSDNVSLVVDSQHMCIQSIFALIDTLENWYSRSLPELTRINNNTPEYSLGAKFCVVIKPVIDGVPKHILGEAALRVKSYARALRYFEIDSRMHYETELSSSNRPLRNDGSNGALPLLESGDLSRLNKIYAELECYDGVQGVQYLRAVNGYRSTSWDKIIELECSGKWQEALVEYGFLKSSLTIASSNRTMCHSEEYSSEWGKVERGRLRCLMELGQMDAVGAQSDFMCESFEHTEEILAAVLPLAIEASWQLKNWDYLSKTLNQVDEIDSLEIRPDDSFQVYVGKLFLAIHTKDKACMLSVLSEARRSIMPALSAASMESYSRAYPFLTKLHILSDIETGFALTQADDVAFSTILNEYHWNEREHMMASSATFQSTQTRVRRAILSMSTLTFDSKTALIESWLHECKLRSGNVESSRYALRNALMHGLDEDVALREECSILNSIGQSYVALTLLEPASLDIARVLEQTNSGNVSLENKQKIAEKLLLATKFMFESSQKHGVEIQKRFESIQKLYPTEEAFYLHATYIESLYSETKQKGGLDKRVLQQYMGEAINLYCKSLQYGTKNAAKSLPKLLTLWFTLTESKVVLPSAGGGGGKGSTSIPLNAQKCVERFLKDMSGIGIIYTCISQLVSRTGHANKETIKIIADSLVQLLTHFPKQSIWHIAGMLHSSDNERRATGKKVVKEAHSLLKRANRKNDADMLEQADKLFRAFINLAKHRPDDENRTNKRYLEWVPPTDLSLHLFVVPSQSALNMCMYGDVVNSDKSAYFAEENVFFRSFETRVEVLMSKEKPKIIKIHTSSGVVMKFLLKQEREGDLRKDARMMEFNRVVNRLLMEDSEGLCRAMRLRTYSVTCLDEECGILEWVNNTNVLRRCIMEAYGLANKPYYKLDATTSVEWTEMQARNAFDIENLVAEYRSTVLSKYKPYLHKWFLSTFQDATKWLEAREAFTRSAAVWSVVGFIVGLGDRHSENILVDVANGECVFVDFDCLFEKGLGLSVPEIVPFRLTPNMVDAMGVTGVEGVYRRTMEVCLNTLRRNSDSLLSILEPFLNDPTVAWSRKGRAQLVEHARGVARDNSADAELALSKISNRLKGIYNLFHPHCKAITKAYIDRDMQIPSKGLGAQIGDNFSLSVRGQAQRLIEEATAEENLAQLFHGWQPWL